MRLLCPIFVSFDIANLVPTNTEVSPIHSDSVEIGGPQNQSKGRQNMYDDIIMILFSPYSIMEYLLFDSRLAC